MGRDARQRRAGQELARCEGVLASKQRKLEGVEDEVRKLRERRARDVARAETKVEQARQRLGAT